MTRKNKEYSGELKIEVVEHMQKRGLSAESVAKHFGIKSKTQPECWM
ncbi:MAG: transposase [Eubacterium sp.]|jgi:transposase-like protein|nr:transposase [Eubacterium sp.]